MHDPDEKIKEQEGPKKMRKAANFSVEVFQWQSSSSLGK